jgi:hypothetical protein
MPFITNKTFKKHRIMKAIVTLAKGHSDVVMVSANNPDSASVMLVTETITGNDQGFLQTEKRVGMIKGKTSDIKALGLKAGDNFSEKVFPVKLVVKESHEPFFPGQTPKINPQTKAVITSLGAPVYRQTIVVSESSAEVDAKLITDKVEAGVGAESEFGKKTARIE